MTIATEQVRNHWIWPYAMRQWAIEFGNPYMLYRCSASANDEWQRNELLRINGK